MDLHEALRTRRTIQRFAPGPIPADALQRALEAALLAPNHKLTYPWRFSIPGPVTRQALFQVGLRLRIAKKGTGPEVEAHVRSTMLDPAHLVVVSQRLDPDPIRRDEDHAACAAAVLNLMLSLHADGVGSMWGTGRIVRDPETFAILGLDPTHERIVAFVWIGRPGIVPQTPRRPPLADVARPLP
jgi:nitroreductase